MSEDPLRLQILKWLIEQDAHVDSVDIIPVFRDTLQSELGRDKMCRVLEFLDSHKFIITNGTYLGLSTVAAGRPMPLEEIQILLRITPMGEAYLKSDKPSVNISGSQGVIFGGEGNSLSISSSNNTFANDITSFNNSTTTGSQSKESSVKKIIIGIIVGVTVALILVFIKWIVPSLK